MSGSCNLPILSDEEVKECEKKLCHATENEDELPEVPQRLKGFNCLSILTTITGSILIILVVAWTGQYRGGFSWDSNTPSKFNWHPMMMTLGMVFLYSNGMLIFRRFRNSNLQRLKLIHTGIIILCFIFTITGLAVGFENHDAATRRIVNSFDEYSSNDHSRFLHIPDMYSLHSWIGLITVFLLFSQCIGGVLSFFYPGIKPFSNPAYVRWHIYFATGGFIGAIFSSLLGFNDKAIMATTERNYRSENVMIWSIYLTLMSFGGLSLYLMSQKNYKRIAKPGDEDPLTAENVFGEYGSGDKEICCLPWTPNDCIRSFRTVVTQLTTPNTTGNLEPHNVAPPPPDKILNDINVKTTA